VALHTKHQFAELCGFPAGKLLSTLSVYTGRGNVVVGDGDFIDDTVEKNRSFLIKQRAKRNMPASWISSPIPALVNTDFEKNLQTNPTGSFPEFAVESQSYTESERQLKYLDTLKRKKEIEKLDIEIAKKKGEVIPSDLVKPVFMQHNQSIITEFNNRSNDFIRIFSKKRSLTVEEIAEVKGEMVKWINEAMDKAILASVRSVENIISENMEKKGVGQHG
jgi:hypothetical protein